MTLAWFSPAADTHAPVPALDDLVTALSVRHRIEHFDARRAHEYVWRQARSPFDLTVYELADTPAHAFVWPYALHAPGLVILRAATLATSRVAELRRRHRLADLRAERRFSSSSMLRAPLAAARLVAVHDACLARALRDTFGDIEIRVAPIGVRQSSTGTATDARARRLDSPARLAVAGRARLDVVGRALERARRAGTAVDLLAGDDLDRLLHDADIVVDPEWPPTGGLPLTALRAMAAARATVVLESEAAAAWPALDPQSWQPRGDTQDAPVVVSVDPRDEEHSLMLAIRRLAADRDLRARLGGAAQDWWRRYASIDAIAEAWEPLLEEAARRPARERPPGWPAHLREDGTTAARAILADIGASVDFLAGDAGHGR